MARSNDDGQGSGLWIALTIVLVLGSAAALFRYRRRSNTESYQSREQLDPVASTDMVTNPVFGPLGTNRQPASLPRPAAAAVYSALADQGSGTAADPGLHMVAYEEADIDPNDTPQYAVATTPAGIYQVAHRPTRFSESATYSVLSAAAGHPEQSAVYDDAYAPTDSYESPAGVSRPGGGGPRLEYTVLGEYEQVEPVEPAPALRAAQLDYGVIPTTAPADAAARHPEQSAVYDDAYAPTDNSDAAGTGNGGAAVVSQHEAHRPVGQTAKGGWGMDKIKAELLKRGVSTKGNGASGPVSTA